ncbi:MAG: ABC transporter substrate-binding protein [Nitrososphaerota archaeon]
MYRLCRVIGAVVFLLCHFSPLSWAQEEIKIGFLGPLTGWATVYGQYVLEGIQLFLEEVGYQFNGVPIKLITADTKGESERVVIILDAFKYRDQVDVIIGPSLGHEGIAAADWALRNPDIPILIGYSAPEDITMRLHSRNVLRPGWSAPQTIMHFGWYVAKVLGYKKIIMVGQDYAYPWDQAAGFIRGFLENGGEEVLRIWHEVELMDFGAIMLQLQSLAGKYDAVLYNGAGGPAIAFFKAWVEFGMNQFYPQVLGQSNFTDPAVLQEYGPEAVGILSTQFYCPQLSNPYNLEFRRKLKERFGHEFPTYPHVQGYDAIRVLFKALEMVGGNVKDKNALIDALYQVRMPDSPRGPWYFDSYGNPIMNIYLQKVVMDERGILVNIPIGTFLEVSQFGPYVGREQQYLSQPRNDRYYPPGKRAEYMAEIAKYLGPEYLALLEKHGGWPPEAVRFVEGEPKW